MDNKNLVDFAEICGIHAGDGWMSSYNNEVGFGTSTYEKEYFEYVFELYKRVFGFDHHRIVERGQNHIIELRIPSKEIQEKLQKAGFVRGPKLDYLEVPDFIWGNQNYIRAFLKGIFDTDGNVYWRRPINQYHLIISFCTSSKEFAKQVRLLLEIEGYHPTMQITLPQLKQKKRRISYKLTIYRMSDAAKFVKEVGFSNLRRHEQVHKREDDLRKRYKLGPPRFELGTFSM